MEDKVDKTIYNSFEQEMIDSGYKIFSSGISYAIRGFQRRFDDDFGKKYFITVWHWNHGKQHPEWNNAPNQDTYQFTTQLRINKNKKELCVDLDVVADVLPTEYNTELTTLSELEAFFEKTWNDMGKPYYETWDES